MGWTRLYCISADTKVRDAAWRLIYYGRQGRVGQLLHAKDWYLKLTASATVQIARQRCRYHRGATQGRIRTATCSSSRSELPAARKHQRAGYNEWDRFTQQQIQNTLLRRIKPQDALVASHKARELKKQS